jgi:hypothetical protein
MPAKKKRGLKVDKELARRVLQEEAIRAQTELAPKAWKERVESLSQVCEEAGVRSHIAVLGNAMLAKATNLNVDPFSLKERDDSPGAYSARGIADKVLGPWTANVGLNIGVSGPNPLNNQPFFHAVRVSERLEGVKGSARRPLEVLCAVLTEVSRIHNEADARDALRAFIEVRQVCSAAPPSYEPSAAVADAPLRALAEEITKFVAEDSEGGKRAQAAVAGLLDVLVGPNRVVTRKINDPSRDSPGDVGILKPGSRDLERVFEVRDKPVAAPDVRRFVEKVAASKIERAAIVSVASRSSVIVPSLFDFAIERGVVLEIFQNWISLVMQVAFWSPAAPPSIASAIHERIYERLVEIVVHPRTLKRWQAIRRGSA